MSERLFLMTKYFMMQMRGSHGWRKERSSAADHVETTSNIGLEEIRQDSEQGGKKRGSEGRHEMSHVQKALDTLNREMVDIKQTLKTIISILPQQWKEESQASGAGLQSTVGLSAILATPTTNRQAHKHAEHMCSKTGANSPDTSGKFEFDQIPVGNSDMEKNEALQQEIDALKREIIRKDEEQLPLQSSDTPEVQHVRHKMGEEMNTRMDSLAEDPFLYSSFMFSASADHLSCFPRLQILHDDRLAERNHREGSADERHPANDSRLARIQETLDKTEPQDDRAV